METKKKFVTDFLFSTPTFLSGAATVISLNGNFYRFNVSKSEIEADNKALENDFRMIGQDISAVIENIKNNDEVLIAE